MVAVAVSKFGLKMGGGGRWGGRPLDPPLISKFQKSSHENNKLLSMNRKKDCFALPLVFKDTLRCRSSEVK